ncbi:hypothetical protein DSUL_160099 [Desulfovibrionales bacterium]
MVVSFRVRYKSEGIVCRIGEPGNTKVRAVEVSVAYLIWWF